jgi:hypothetical protein
VVFTCGALYTWKSVHLSAVAINVCSLSLIMLDHLKKISVSPVIVPAALELTRSGVLRVLLSVRNPGPCAGITIHGGEVLDRGSERTKVGEATYRSASFVERRFLDATLS